MDQAQIRESPPATDRHPNHWATPPTKTSLFVCLVSTVHLGWLRSVTYRKTDFLIYLCNCLDGNSVFTWRINCSNKAIVKRHFPPKKNTLLTTQCDNYSGGHCSLLIARSNYLCRKIVSPITQQASYCLSQNNLTVSEFSRKCRSTQDLSVFPFLPRHYHMTRVLLSPFINTV